MRILSKTVLKAEWAWWLAFLLTLAVIPRVFGEEAVATTPRQVTVFPDCARVTREGALKLSAGSHRVVFPDLPASVVESSLRLTLEGPPGTKLYGVSLRSDYAPEVVEKHSRLLKARLQTLEDQKTDLADRMEARKTEIELLKGLAKEGTQTATAQSPTRPETLADFTHSVDAVERRLALLMAENRKDERLTRNLQSKTDALQKELDQNGSLAKENRVAEADIELPRAGKAVFTLAYQVSDASWTPLYDLRLATNGEKPRMDLAFNAGVRQKTGEDWNGVALTLSTARPTEGTQVPETGDWWLDFFEQTRISGNFEAAKTLGGVAEMAPPAPSEVQSLAMKDLPEDKAPAEVVTAQTLQAPYAMSFSIPTRRDIPSDGADHRVGIAQNTQPVDLHLVAVPRFSQAAYLQAHVTYSGEQALLPGPVQLFRDGVFVGATRLQARAPGEAFDLGFGQDDSIRVERKLVKNQSGESQGVFDIRKGERRYQWVTTITNYHPMAMAVEIREQLPRSRQKDITVDQTDASPKPQDPDKDKPGLVCWKLDLSPRQKAKLTFGYAVKFPDNAQVTGLE